MQKDTGTFIETKLKELQGIICQYEDERSRSSHNLANISKTHDTVRNNNGETKMSEYFKTKLRSLYQTAVNDANSEISVLKKALETIHEIRAIRYEKRLSSKNMEGPQETIRRSDLMNLLKHNGMNLPLWIGKKHESPPALCGAIPAEPNYIAKIGDMVAALVKGSNGEENWILAEVTHYNSSLARYEVDDIDVDAKEKHTLSRRKIIPLPLMRANPETNSEALFPRESLVLALFPRSTCFYRALVKDPPLKPHEEYSILFEDTAYDDGYSPPLPVAQRYVISYKEGRKK